jgi:ribosomal protein S27E
MKREEFDSRQQAVAACEIVLFECADCGEEITVFTGDPHQPTWVECPECSRLMDRKEELNST